MTLHSCDASQATCIDTVAADSFRRDGLLVLRNVLAPDELSALQAETAALIEAAAAQGRGDPDHLYDANGLFFRIEYILDKLESAKALLGHPFLLRTVKELQGPFIPTWDSMVFKLPGSGAAIPWHRDTMLGSGDPRPLMTGSVFNVDVYLDRADLASCVWGIPGSNTWDDERAVAETARRNVGEVQVDGAVPILMEPGDVLLHNVVTLHGSKATSGPLRRVIYFEFRPVEIELLQGPHVPEYVPLKQQVLAAAVRRRSTAPYAAGEASFDPGFDPWSCEDPPTWRYPHEQYWRQTA